jgi:hypothetical protein
MVITYVLDENINNSAEIPTRCSFAIEPTIPKPAY